MDTGLSRHGSADDSAGLSRHGSADDSMDTELFDRYTALIIADMIRDFVQPGGALVVTGAARLIAPLQHGLRAAHAAGATVIYMVDSHRPDDAEFRAWPPHGLASTGGREIVPELAPEPTDIVLPKRRFSSFFGTELDMVLREHAIRRLVLAGLLTDICIYHTAVDAFELNYEVVIAEDATAAATEEEHAWALRQAKRLLEARIVRLGKEEIPSERRPAA